MIQTHNEFIKNITKLQQKSKLVTNNKKIEYYNFSVSFDIETTSFYNENNIKSACMYVWQINFFNNITIGRNWQEFVELIDKITNIYKTNDKKRIIIYVHNLSFEFQFIRKRFNWIEVFSLETRKVVQCLTDKGIEFRCSYILSGYNLETLGKIVGVKKLVGELDYEKIRHSQTILTESELNYCINDVLIVNKYIDILIKEYGLINIPLTKTGFVRKECMKKTLRKNNKTNYYYVLKIKEQTLTKNEYIFAKQAFAGGFTHSNPNNTDKEITNVYSYDICSAYPYAMISEKFPCSKGLVYLIKDVQEYKELSKEYCIIGDLTYKKLLTKNTNEMYISESRCLYKDNICTSNGRVVGANELRIIITEIDFDIIEKMYNYESVIIGLCIIYKKDYLPKEFVSYILELYLKKTTLKDVENREREYMVSKENLNSLYGMCVTDIVRTQIKYENDSFKEITNNNIVELIDNYNKSKKRFISYLWGVWVTAYTRKRLFDVIPLLSDNYIYSDTDSIKYKYFKDSEKIFEQINENITKKITELSKIFDISEDYFSPCTIHGIKKKIGIWEFEGCYDCFKTLGAKRYLIKQKDKYKLTVSGLGKDVINWIKTQTENVFEFFKNDMTIPSQHTGKLTKTYIDNETSGYIVDYNGKIGYYNEKSSLHLEPAPYKLSLSEIYLNYILSLKNKKK